jgi:hypothetical protein
MQLTNGEQVLKVFHHHPTMFVFRGGKIIIASLPFYLVGSFFNGVFSAPQMAVIFSIISIIFVLIIAYDFTFYYLDRLFITNRRVIHQNWDNALQREEHEVELADIQDIATKETGIFSYLKIFDFGSFRLETASKSTAISFKGAPDPEGIRHFIYHLDIKPNRIGSVRNLNADYDRTKRTNKTIEEEATVSTDQR